MKNDLSINRYSLEEECVRQVDLMEEASRRLADARIRSDELKTVVENLSAEVDERIRKDPLKHGLAKITEANVAAAVSRNKIVQQAKDDLANMSADVLRLNARVTTLEHRKKMLESLIYLHGQGYFSSPKNLDNFEQLPPVTCAAGDNPVESTSRIIRKPKR